MPELNIDCITFRVLNQSSNEVHCTICGDKKEKHARTLIHICRCADLQKPTFLSSKHKFKAQTKLCQLKRLLHGTVFLYVQL